MKECVKAHHIKDINEGHAGILSQFLMVDNLLQQRLL